MCFFIEFGSNRFNNHDPRRNNIKLGMYIHKYKLAPNSIGHWFFAFSKECKEETLKKGTFKITLKKSLHPMYITRYER